MCPCYNMLWNYFKFWYDLMTFNDINVFRAEIENISLCIELSLQCIKPQRKWILHLDFNIIVEQLFGDYTHVGILLSTHLSPNYLFFFFHSGYRGFGNHPTASSYYAALFSISWLFWGTFCTIKIERLNAVSSFLSFKLTQTSPS